MSWLISGRGTSDSDRVGAVDRLPGSSGIVVDPRVSRANSQSTGAESIRAGPTPEYLAEQVDKLRDGMEAIRRSGVDESRRLGDLFANQIQGLGATMVRELTSLRNEVGTIREACKVEQSLIRADLAGLKAQTTALVERFDRTQDFLKQLLFWLVGSILTVGGGLFWKASQAVHQIDEQGRRIESIEKKADDSQSKLRDLLDQFRKTLDERLPGVPVTPR